MTQVIVKFTASHGAYGEGEMAGFSPDQARNFEAQGVAVIVGGAKKAAPQVAAQVDVLAGLPAGEVSDLVDADVAALIGSDAVKARVADLADRVVEDRIETLAHADAEKVLKSAKVKARIKSDAAAIVEVRVAEMAAAQASEALAAQEAVLAEHDAAVADAFDADLVDPVAEDPQTGADVAAPADDLPAQG